MNYDQPAPLTVLQKPHVASIVATVTGVLSLLVLPFVFGPIAVVAGIIGLVLSQTQGRNVGFALTGLVLGLSGIVATLMLMFNALSVIL